MMFNVLGLVFSPLFLNIIYATQNLDQESEYNCTIETVDNGVRDKMKLLLEDGKKVTFIHLLFTNQINPFSDTYRGALYSPMDWVRIAGRHGRSLLFLRPEFEQLSLTTLSLETGYMNVSLVQKPENCLLHFNTTIVEDKLRDLLLSDFKPGKDGGSLSEHEYICNMHIRNDNSNAKFFYRCCHKDPDGNIICKNLTYDYWIYVVFICVIIINIVAIMFSPYLIPVSLYREKYGRSIYEHKLVKPLQVKVKKVFSTEHADKNTVSIEKLKGMPSLFQCITDWKGNEEKTLSLSKVYIAVQYRKLIPANYVPVGIINTFYNMFVKCHIRKSLHFGECCKSNILGKTIEMNETCDGSKCTKKLSVNYPWYRCLKQFMRIVMLIGFSLPWIIRIVFFYWYENPHTLQRVKAASERNMTLSFQWNLINTLTPIHIVFLLCYTVTVVDAVVFGIVSHNVKERLQLLMRKCFRDMRDMSRSKALEWSALVLVVPFEQFGIFGFFLFGIYFVIVFPVILGVLAFYCLPTMNLVLRLLVHFVAYLMPYAKHSTMEGAQIPLANSVTNANASYANINETLRTCHEMFHLNMLSDNESLERPQTITMKNRFLQLFVLIACLSTVVSFILLTMEMVLFITEIFIYTIIGIIMNASAMLKYISLIFMLGLYARDCFKGISDKYLEFNKSINRLIVDKVRRKVEKIANLSSYVQKNTAFQVQMDDTEENVNDKVKTVKDTKNDKHVVDHEKMEKDTENVNNKGKIEKHTENFKLVFKDGKLKWKIRRLILFLDVNDKPYLPEKFFEATCIMNSAGVPGPLIYNIVQATWRFLCICVFLMFVVLVVLAFGDEYQISGTNQMLATLAGGFLPWVFRNILFKPKDSLALDSDNLSFKSNLRQEIEKYEQKWDIDDIVGSEIGETIHKQDNSNTATVSSCSENDKLIANEEDDKFKLISIRSVETDRVHHKDRRRTF
ncbi:unnamed protein product [Mytilus coruscus]|uniref:Uncharacterized protein n=1 Tax=Mytilus coruscus TaxID=42192 RepID=A0A6J8BH29_MYTCO|nr:unnamed protein product [Mytilus coruscus]